GGSGDRYGSLPTDFGVVEGTKREEKVYKVWAGRGEQCTVMYSVLNMETTGVIVLGFGNIGPCECEELEYQATQDIKKKKTTTRKSPEEMTPSTFSLGLTPEESEPTEKEKEKQVEKRAKGKATTDEVMMTQYLFSMEGEELDFVFETKDGVATIRDYMQTLAPQLKVESNVIDTFSLILNHEHKMNSKEKRTKYYFHTTMIKKANGKYDEKKQFEAFSKAIKSEFKKDTKMRNMKDLEMKKLFSMHLEKVKHPSVKDVLNKKPTIIRPKWGTIENDRDCGIFMMMHMEHYNRETAKNWNLKF
nr:hypothetical protein [Tanacetum cinerariifolium]